MDLVGRVGTPTSSLREMFRPSRSADLIAGTGAGYEDGGGGLSPSLTSIPATPSRIIGQCGEGGDGDRGTGGELIIPPPTASSAGYPQPKLVIVNALSLPVVLPSGERSSAGFDGGSPPRHTP